MGDKDKIQWEDFFAQHEGIQDLKEYYTLTDDELREACVQGISSLIKTKMLADKLGEKLCQKL